jgi:hypothetical protein
MKSLLKLKKKENLITNCLFVYLNKTKNVIKISFLEKSRQKNDNLTIYSFENRNKNDKKAAKIERKKTVLF